MRLAECAEYHMLLHAAMSHNAEGRQKGTPANTWYAVSHGLSRPDLCNVTWPVEDAVIIEQ